VPTRRPTIALAAVVLGVALATAACGGSGAPSVGPNGPVDGVRDATRLFASACAACHGPRGEGGVSGVPLVGTSAADRQLVVDAIRYGTGAMPASSAGMTDEQIEALADFVAGLR